jgi:eukaryotic-like serine/threonine-protein kinase
MAFATGARVGDYEVIVPLGTGGLGQVYRVRHTISDRNEAMKVLLPAEGQSLGDARFLREIRVLASLDHPHIAKLHTAFRHEGQLVMIMEFVEGVTLRSKLKHSRLTIGQSLDYLRQALEGLSYAHSHGVVHRDVKPSNIMITAGDRIKLLDFGLALSGANPELTRTGMIMGSLHYMSPEQVEGARVDLRSDLYSAGITLYQLLTGRPPIDGASEFAIAMAHLRDIPKPPHELNPLLPAGLSEVVLRALQKRPEQRFASAAEFRQALDGFGDEATMLTAAILPTHESSQPDSERKPPHRPTSSLTPRSTLTGANFLSDVSRELASFIGPIARVLVNRAASQCTSLEELYANLAKEITEEGARRLFLATRSKYSGMHSTGR